MGIIRAFRNAGRGIGLVLQGRNARIHLAAALIVLAACVVLQVTVEELAAVIFAILMVFLAEIANTALEQTLDMIQPEQHPVVRRLKDMAAGGVLVAAIGAAVIGVIVFYPYLLELVWRAQ